MKSNVLGCLGSGTEEDQFLPAQIEIPATAEVFKIVAGPHRSMLILGSGRVLGFGSNEKNKLGMNFSVKGVTKSEANHN